MPYTGHDEETFDVKGVKFWCSDYIVTAGFNNTASHGLIRLAPFYVVEADASCLPPVIKLGDAGRSVAAWQHVLTIVNRD